MAATPTVNEALRTNGFFASKGDVEKEDGGEARASFSRHLSEASDSTIVCVGPPQMRDASVQTGEGNDGNSETTNGSSGTPTLVVTPSSSPRTPRPFSHRSCPHNDKSRLELPPSSPSSFYLRPPPVSLPSPTPLHLRSAPILLHLARPISPMSSPVLEEDDLSVRDFEMDDGGGGEEKDE
jgi:hypothetical protein